MNRQKPLYSMLFLSLLLALTVGCASQSKGKGAHAFAQKGMDDGASVQQQPVDPFDDGGRVIGEQPLAGLIRENPNSGMCERVHFDYDKAGIKEEYKACLDAIARFFKANTRLTLVIEGHCDERGSNEYNMALGERRAVATAQYLIAQGLGESRINTRSMGEEKPLETCSNESCWSKNRRADFYFVQQSR
ncbi:MAG: peptidoglycan-associated lipoprotein Pal [Candidatus Hinthialibacter antarcticus]|nr:peptidoglycan-associated lipoprotein Pal [Candidatus Hinthialibacter antarcticus]